MEERQHEHECQQNGHDHGPEQNHNQEHDHEHDHDHHHTHHEHSHDHGHEHAHGEDISQEETLALLAYMASHNKHHAEELSNLATGIKGEASFHLQNAIGLFNEGNEELEKALNLMK